MKDSKKVDEYQPSPSNLQRPVSLLESKSSASMISPLRKGVLENVGTNGSMLRTMSYSSHFLPSYSAKVRSVINSVETKALFSSHEKLLNWKATKDIDPNYSINEGINKITNLQSGLLKIMSSSASSSNLTERNGPDSQNGAFIQEEAGVGEDETKSEHGENPTEKKSNIDDSCNNKQSPDDMTSSQNQEKPDFALINHDSTTENSLLHSRNLLPSSTSPINVDELLDWDIEDNEEEQFYSFNSIDLERKSSLLANMTREQKLRLLERTKREKHRSDNLINNNSPFSGRKKMLSGRLKISTANGNLSLLNGNKDSIINDKTKAQLINTVKCIEATAGLASKDSKLFSNDIENNVWRDDTDSFNANDDRCAKDSENDRVTSILKSAIIDSSNSLINSFLQHNNESPYHKASTSSSVADGGNGGRLFDDWSRRTSASVSSTFSRGENRGVDIDLLDLYCDDELHPSLEHDPNMQLFIAHTPSPHDDIETESNDISRPFLTDRGRCH